jgi:large subunit ribosomal protein L7/L12
VQRLAQELLGLTVLESSWLTEILRKKLNLQKPAYGAMPAMGFPGAPVGGQPQMAGQGPAAQAPAAAPAAAEPKKEKTEVGAPFVFFWPHEPDRNCAGGYQARVFLC